MILVRILEGEKAVWGVMENDDIHLLSEPPYERITKTGEMRKAGQVRYLAPCEPTNIIAVGKNYADHIAELDSPMPEDPTIFFKPITSLNHPDANIVLPPRTLSKRIDFEGELAFVIKKKAYHVPVEEAQDYILGYTCMNDVTARDLQRKDGQWARAKGFDGFGPAGPWLSDEIDPFDCQIQTRVNGKVEQKSNTSLMLWDVGHLMTFITTFMTLLPGDIVTTGTPEGVGPLHDGDVVEIDIAGIGVLRNTVISTEE